MIERTRLRPLNASDAPEAARIYHDAVWIGTRELYDEAQRRAWAGGDAPDPARMRARLERLRGLIAELDDAPIGFMTYDATGLIDLAYVAPAHARKGVGALLLAGVEAEFLRLGVTRIHADASLASRPFFERRGFSVEGEVAGLVRGQRLASFRMTKALAP